jgi:hypothetical protein
MVSVGRAIEIECVKRGAGKACPPPPSDGSFEDRSSGRDPLSSLTIENTMHTGSKVIIQLKKSAKEVEGNGPELGRTADQGGRRWDGVNMPRGMKRNGY